MKSILLFVGLAVQALAIPRYKAVFKPQAKHATYIANVTDPVLSRDSCGSVSIGERTFWTCRDTTLYNSTLEKCTFPMVTNSASWTNRSVSGGPAIQQGGTVGAGSTGSNSILQMYGNDAESLTKYFPVLEDMCPDGGNCDDGSRWVVWPDQPPLITQESSEGSAVGYSWVAKSHLENLTLVDPDPAWILYKTSYFASGAPNDALPMVTVINPSFWNKGEVGFGGYGTLIRNGIAYLYGQTSMGRMLAKVPAHQIEDQSAYRYFVNGKWTKTLPSKTNYSAVVANAGTGGQGTFYYSAHHKSYIWIGQAWSENMANFYISTAPSPEGPWAKPYKIWEGENGDNAIAGGYSIQAHPGLSEGVEGRENGIYVSWTQQWDPEKVGMVYITPLVWLEFE